MRNKSTVWHTINLIIGAVVFLIGVLNLFLVHAVPGIAFLLLAFIYYPPTDALLMEYLGFATPPLVKTILGIVIIWFTLGVSDLGDMIDGHVVHTTVVIKSTS